MRDYSTASSKKHIISNFKLSQRLDVTIKETSFENLKKKHFASRICRIWIKVKKETDTVDAIYLHNPVLDDLVYAYLAKKRNPKLTVIIGDLILSPIKSIRQKMIALAKKRLLKYVDHIIAIHKYTKGYEDHYHISPSKFHYIPFKVNKLSYIKTIATSDEGYVLSTGASCRDFELLAKAINGTGIPAVIVCSKAAENLHNARFKEPLPSNITRVDRHLEDDEYYQYIANSRLVVIPIQSEAIQPAGISVCLEAMALAKAVIITDGASSRFLVDNGEAIVTAPNDHLELNAAINRLFYNASERTALEKRGNVYANKLGEHGRFVEDITKKIIELICTN